MKEPWRICPDCGIGPGEDHKPKCPGARKPWPGPNYSSAVRVTRVVRKKKVRRKK